MDEGKKGFIQGVIYSAAILSQYSMDAHGLLLESGLTVEEIRKYGEEQVLEVLKGILEIL